MDAVEFFKETKRLCNSYVVCDGCPLFGYFCDFSDDLEKSVVVVEQWSREHPKMTNADKLVEVFGPITFNDITSEWLGQEYREPEGKE